MTGWRIGYAVAHEPLMTAMRKLVLYSTNGVPTMVQWAAVEALRLSPEFRQKRLAEYRERRDALVGGLHVMGFECEVPAGAFYAFPLVHPAFGRQPRGDRSPYWKRRTLPPFRARCSVAMGKGTCASAIRPPWG